MIEAIEKAPIAVSKGVKQLVFFRKFLNDNIRLLSDILFFLLAFVLEEH